MNKEACDAVNTLLWYLRGFGVVPLIKQHYTQYHNDAPSTLLEEQIWICQHLLDRALFNLEGSGTPVTKEVK